MGIQGLLPFLKKASRQANIKDFKGCTVAIDSYCWLHKGAFSCADKLGTGQETTQYVYYCLKYVNYLLSCNIKPIMVFDGCRLPSKQSVEKARRERREINSKKAKQLLREGRNAEAKEYLQRSIDITPKMALELMKACRNKGVDCIVAPYEADAQLAYLNKIGVAQVIITEDSDLVLFGCEKIMFKMDTQGNGMLIEKSKLNQTMDLRPDVYSFDKFRYMCILSGCDYLASLPGIGLGKANKLFKLSRQDDIILLLRKLPTILKMSNLTVPKDYIEGFIKANNTFLYQLVFDPLKRKLVPLNPYPPEVNPDDLHYAGPPISADKALQIALGNIDLYTHEKVEDYDPDIHKMKSTSWDTNSQHRKHLLHQLSIWDKNYSAMPKSFQTVNLTQDLPSTKGKEVTVKVSLPPVKRVRPVQAPQEQISDKELLGVYGSSESELPSPKRARLESRENIMASDNQDKTCSLTILDIEPVDEKFPLAEKSEINSSHVQGKENSPNKKVLSPVKSPTPSPSHPDKKPSRNVFAKNVNSAKEKFQLNARKTEYKQSRFFQEKNPLPKTAFGQALGEELGEDNPTRTANTGESSPEQQRTSAPFTDSPQPLLKKSFSQGAFSFKKLDSFKRFGNSPLTGNQFKAVISSQESSKLSLSQGSNSPSSQNSKESYSINNSIDQSFDDSGRSSPSSSSQISSSLSFQATLNSSSKKKSDILSMFKNTPQRQFHYTSESSTQGLQSKLKSVSSCPDLPAMPDLSADDISDSADSSTALKETTNSTWKMSGSRQVGLSRNKSSSTKQKDITSFLSSFKKSKSAAEKIPSVRN